MAGEAVNLYGVHDWDQAWAALVKSAARSAWCIVTLEIGDSPNDLSGQDFSHIASQGITVIGRLNYNHHGQGTIPVLDRYDEFAARCANFVRASKGCFIWMIGNEPNLAGERPGVPITPTDYALCFRLCRDAIKKVSVQHRVITAGIAPYNVDSGPWVAYFRSVLTAIGPDGVDGIGLHTYSRGGGPQSITSEDKMNPPYDAFYNGFRAYRDFLAAVPEGMKTLPVYITETDQNIPWVDANSGWVRAAYGEIDWWNRQSGTQKIHCLCLYRWSTDDKWNFSQKHGVVDDFSQTMRDTDYRWPTTVTPPGPTGPRLTVTAPAGAQVRLGPGITYSSRGIMPFGSVLKVTGRNQDSSWWRVDTPLGSGWISSSIVKTEEISGVPIVPITVPTPPVVPQTLGKDWMIGAWSRILGVDERVMRAILAIESGGRSFEGDRMMIRFENHIFIDQIKKLAPSMEGVVRQHFRYGDPSHTGHEYRVSDNGLWERQHDGGQAEEWAAFNYARSMHPEAAMKAISMGSGQVMGFNHAGIGYPTVQAMFDDFNNKNTGELNQLTGFFSYINNRAGLVQAVKDKDWNFIASAYNGTGGVAQYAPMLRQKYIDLGGT